MVNSAPLSQEYMGLVSVLNSRLSGPPLAVEIIPDFFDLPPGHNYEIVDQDKPLDMSIVFHKKTLIKAFHTAHHIFFSNLDDVNKNQANLLDSSMIILLFDPEHLTAANVRKKIALTYGRLNIDQLTLKLRDEMWLNKFFLMSKMKRHNKSPTLWAHRKWLMKTFQTEILSGVLLNTPELNMHEVTIVIGKSAENHPRNYYAWDYARWWVNDYAAKLTIATAITDLMGEEFDDADLCWNQAGENENVWGIKEKFLLAHMRMFCMRHVSDISGWSFFRYLLSDHRMKDHAMLRWQLMNMFGADILKQAMVLGYTNESMWWFLRSIHLELYIYQGQPWSAAFPKLYWDAILKLSQKEPKESWLKKFAEKEIRRVTYKENGSETCL